MIYYCMDSQLVVEELILLGTSTCPVATTTFLLFSKSIISMLFLSHMGKSELAGVVLAIGVVNLTCVSIMKGLCMGMDPICFQAYGAKRFAVLSQTYIKTFILLLFICIPITFLWLNIEPVLHGLGQDHSITKVAATYLLFCLPEIPALAHLFPLRSFLRAQGLNSPTTIVATCATILHLPINYFLVSYLKLGIKGVALASTSFTYNMNVGLALYVYKSNVAIKPSITKTIMASVFKGWGPLLSLSIPCVCSVCLEWWLYEIILFLSGLLANPQSCVAATGIIMQLTGLVYVMPFSLSLSISQRVGHELGGGQPARAQWAATIGISTAFIYGLVIFALYVTLRNVLGMLYTNEPDILIMLSSALPILGLAEVGNALQTAACGVLTGSARPKVGVKINIAAFYLVGLPMSVVLAFVFKLDYQGLWLGMVASQAACALLMVCTLIKTDWRDQAKRAEELTLTVNKDDMESVELVP
ncbi:putative multi antimicrobial extrusion protein [Helianthus annuus]|uniref:Protein DETOXIFICATION n=1 Tax=Helianthus annuus TaxID=4232 RepID=A0A9K3JTB4_HELAN|nr:putative multi antimicrobial extrusion protein [Helianthus annuus]KAJ0610100.1 putative multi antimicrobial extrusion protein [Helianthus annuus]